MTAIIQRDQSKTHLAMPYPCTLRAIAEAIGDRCGGFHIYGEYNGFRYYMGSAFYHDHARWMLNRHQQCYPEADFYIRDKADSTEIDGDCTTLREVYSEVYSTTDEEDEDNAED
jgi:hypothetical protein